MTHELNHAGAPARASDDEKMDGAAASPVAGSQSSGHAADADAHLGGAHGEAVDREHRWWSMEEDRRVRRKLDMRILPILFVTYLLAALVRVQGETCQPCVFRLTRRLRRTARTSATPRRPA